MSNYVYETPCNPCPKYCRRPAYPRIGWLGVLGYLVEAVTVIWVGFMWIGVASRDCRIVLGLLLGTILFDFLFWAINLFTAAPCYSLQTLPSLCDPCGCELIVKGDPCDYHARLLRDLHHNNDQQHLSTSVIGGLYVLFYFAWFVGSHGSITFEPLTAIYDPVHTMYFSVAQTILLAIIGAFGYGFKLLLETHSDLMLRHFTAIPDQSTKRGNEEMSYAARQKSITARRSSPLDAFSSL